MLIKIRAPFRCKYILFMVEYEMILYGIQTGRIKEQKMEILYNSTRSEGNPVKASEAILRGLSRDGGLFVPERIPLLDKTVDELTQMTYGQTAYEVMKLYLTDFTEEELKDCIAKAYDEKFDTDRIAPIVEADGAYFWNFSMGQPLLLKIWHCRSCLTFSPPPRRRTK